MTYASEQELRAAIRMGPLGQAAVGDSEPLQHVRFSAPTVNKSSPDSDLLELLAAVKRGEVPDVVQFANRFRESVSAFNRKHNTPEGQATIQRAHDELARGGAVCKSSKSAEMASRHEPDAIQSAHDQLVEHGAKCSDTTTRPAYFSSGPQVSSDAEKARIDAMIGLTPLGQAVLRDRDKPKS